MLVDAKRTRCGKSTTYLVVNAEGLIGVLDKLVDRESGIVWFHNGVRDLGRWHDRESRHHTVWEFFPDLGDQQGSHTSTSSTTQGVCDLETLEAITAFGFAADHIKDLIHQFRTFGVMPLCPVVTGTRLTVNEVIRTEELTEWTSTDSIHGARLQVDQDCAGHIFLFAGLCGC